MTMHAHQVVVGVFDERGLADTAVDELQNAGFTPDQIYYAGEGEKRNIDYWQAISKFFTRNKTADRDAIGRELKDLGLSDDEIRYFESEYDNGRTIVAVNAPGRAEEALAILRANGAHK